MKTFSPLTARPRTNFFRVLYSRAGLNVYIHEICTNNSWATFWCIYNNKHSERNETGRKTKIKSNYRSLKMRLKFFWASATCTIYDLDAATFSCTHITIPYVVCESGRINVHEWRLFPLYTCVPVHVHIYAPYGFFRFFFLLFFVFRTLRCLFSCFVETECWIRMQAAESRPMPFSLFLRFVRALGWFFVCETGAPPSSLQIQKRLVRTMMMIIIIIISGHEYAQRTHSKHSHLARKQPKCLLR